MALLRFLASLHGRVSRAAYLRWGLALMAVKYAVEAGVLWATQDRWLTPWMFANPLLARQEDLYGATVGAVLLLWTLPFLWIALAMTARRAVDAGVGAWVALTMLLPMVNWVVMIVLAILPTRAPPPSAPAASTPPRPHERTAPASMAILIVAGTAPLLTLGMIALAVYGLHEYGSALFLITPGVIGMLGGVIAASCQRPRGEAFWLGQLGIAASLMTLLCFGYEGAICLFMAWIAAAPVAAVGSIIGWGVVQCRLRHATTLLLLAALTLPLIAAAEHRQASPSLRAVRSEVVIHAPPAVVWQRVLAFPPLPPPDGIFALGIACPLRAHLDGTGVGAIRSCEFTTGAFIEPITAWEPCHRLAFDVRSQPPALRELSPWGDVHAPHLDGFLVSQRGEFLLLPEADGSTRLVGTTWYTLAIHPGWYWSWWADGFIHRIHDRVLTHIAALADSDARAAAGASR